MTIKPAFELGQVVYLKTDDEQFERMVVGIYMSLDKKLTYFIRFADEEPTEHYYEEILDTKRTF